jgi:hypothetical protein
VYRSDLWDVIGADVPNGPPKKARPIRPDAAGVAGLEAPKEKGAGALLVPAGGAEAPNVKGAKALKK